MLQSTDFETFQGPLCPNCLVEVNILYLYFCMAYPVHAWCAQYCKNLYLWPQILDQIFATWPKCSNCLYSVATAVDLRLYQQQGSLASQQRCPVQQGSLEVYVQFVLQIDLDLVTVRQITERAAFRCQHACGRPLHESCCVSQPTRPCVIQNRGAVSAKLKTLLKTPQGCFFCRRFWTQQIEIPKSCMRAARQVQGFSVDFGSIF